MKITPKQLARLQVLYSQFTARELGADKSREGRIRWAIERTGRKVASFKDLTLDEGKFLIDSLQGALGVRVPPVSRPDRDQARRAGLDGRSDGQEFAAAPQMVLAIDMERIQRLLDTLGWSHETFVNFLNSSRSPLAKRADKAICTISDANKVWWALKAIATAKGLWRKSA